MKRITTILFLAAMTTACAKKKQEPAPEPAPIGSNAMTGSAAMGSAEPVPTGSAAGSAAMTGSNAAAAAGSAVDVPTEVDFEDEANAKITDKNLDSEVSAFEKQLGK
ncbi:MAG: hypothetical protein JWO36_6623 [Myxococcales bacterium]|nr:hypothetical protein [Myxococcales bacterium]